MSYDFHITFETEAEFIASLREQTEKNYAFSFLPGSKYPLHVILKRTNDRLVVPEVV